MSQRDLAAELRAARVVAPDHVREQVRLIAAAAHASTAGRAASADLTLKVPRAHVAQAISRLSALGTIVGEQVDVQDAQAGLNATTLRIARLQRQLADLRAETVQTDAVKQQIAALTARIEALQRQQAA